MPRYLTLLFLDYRLLGNRSDCLRALKDLHITLIDPPPHLPPTSAFALTLPLTDKNTLRCCRCRAPPSIFTCRAASKEPRQPLQPLVICTAIDHLFPSKG